jgi:hypothetical protein
MSWVGRAYSLFQVIKMQSRLGLLQYSIGSNPTFPGLPLFLCASVVKPEVLRYARDFGSGAHAR